jgi:hypothetical protein
MGCFFESRRRVSPAFRKVYRWNLAIALVQFFPHVLQSEVIGKAVVTMELDEKDARLKQMNQPTDPQKPQP